MNNPSLFPELESAECACESAKRTAPENRAPQADSVSVAKLLGMLGKDDMVKALFALLLAAEAEKIAMPPQAEARLTQACDHIEEMRDMLILALNVKPEGRRA